MKIIFGVMDGDIDAGNEVGASAAEGVEGSLLVVAVAASVGPGSRGGEEFGSI